MLIQVIKMGNIITKITSIVFFFFSYFKSLKECISFLVSSQRKVKPICCSVTKWLIQSRFMNLTGFNSKSKMKKIHVSEKHL